MTLFRNQTEQEVWIGHHCDRCHSPLNTQDGCPILTKALESQRKPRQWKRNQRVTLMKEAFKCEEFADQPPRITRAAKSFEDVPMFEVPAEPVYLVPIENWPDRPGIKGVDHA